MRILMISNGRSGTPRRRAKVVALAERLREDGALIESFEPGTAELMRERARDARRRHHDVLLVAGGDGSLHAAVNGLVQVPKHERPALAVLPVGRGNDFAAEIGVRSIDDALQALRGGESRRLDLGRSEAGVFLGVAGTGFDARVARRARETRLLSGSLLYSYAVFRTLVDFEPVEMRVRFDGGVYEGPLVFAAVANSGRYGGGMRIAPEASMEDARFDICLVEPISRLTLVRMLPKVFSGSHLGHPRVEYRRSAFVEVETREPAEVFADGELLQPTPLRVETLPGELEVLVPKRF